MENENKREPSYGEQAVGLTFNPSENKDVNIIKELYAQIIDKLNFLRDETETKTSGERKRLLSVAITEAQTAQMWAVKSITYQY